VTTKQVRALAHEEEAAAVRLMVLHDAQLFRRQIRADRPAVFSIDPAGPSSVAIVPPAV
jgi:hypothetical protein